MAVVAAVPDTEETRYDDFLISGMARDDARDRVREDIDRVLRAWQESR